ncbi:IclR family transcriptional regulator [Citricoccus muralis]|uniref:IclR family transcriptional regulator n=1 Tax=Citricoccus muralis TaxID=169134 RepID=A0A3D9L988_9MICC|nr:IclR family transcriptional regulator [Citricoccus muralis]REE02928.1 IclR family transcriptional regulator [Citricoccus muralis]
MLSRMASILRAFDRGAEELTATEVSRRTGLPASTCHRIMRSLAEEGVLEIGEGHRYHVGLWLWEVAAHAPRSGGMQQAALPFMQDLMDITGHPVHLAVREGSQAVFIERMSHWRARNSRPYIGSHYPLHLTSVGLMLLAHAPTEVQEDYLTGRLEQRTPLTVTSPQELRRMLASIRSRGFAVSDRQVVMDAISVAAPIRDTHGQVIAALSVNTPLGSLKEQTMAHAVQTTALAITRSMALNVQMNR